MPILDNPKWERFAQELAKGKTADEAYVLAGYKENRHNASRLKTTETISARLAELLDLGAKRVVVNKDRLTEMYFEDRKLAREIGQPAAARACLDSIAKMHGIMIDRQEIGAPGDFDRMSDEELAEYVRREAGAVSKEVH